ncbi:MAG: Rpn family recombination-promoting nuclease/putative transposase [Treponema sp.]|nr:Rpn family recombination-promoting nuclease/putative transposase [Treponema sp.]
METRKLTPEEKWERATLADNFIFYKVMRNHPRECQEVIELLLGIKIKSMTMHSEEQIDLDHDSKGVRLDVYVQDEDRMFDIEIQVTNTRELPERSRYYSALMSLDSLKSGEPYRMLKESHVIFICMEDIFVHGLPVYTFEDVCLENNAVKLEDRDYRHFFIAPICARMIRDENKRRFFEFLISNTAGTALTDRLRDCVEDAKHNMQWRFMYMTWERQQYYAYQSGHEEGLAEGHAAGERKKALEDAWILINDFNINPEIAAEKLGVPLSDILEMENEKHNET